MNNRNWTRRDIGRLAVAGLFAAGSVVRGQQRRQITAREVVERIRRNVGIPWRSHTCDTFKWGDPKLKVTRVVDGGHYIAQTMAAAQDADVVMGGDVREWETVEYFRDVVTHGQKKALIVLPHEGAEEAGMEECAIWLQGFVTEVPVQFIASGDPFWIPSTAKLNA